MAPALTYPCKHTDIHYTVDISGVYTHSWQWKSPQIRATLTNIIRRKIYDKRQTRVRVFIVTSDFFLCLCVTFCSSPIQIEHALFEWLRVCRGGAVRWAAAEFRFFLSNSFAIYFSVACKYICKYQTRTRTALCCCSTGQHNSCFGSHMSGGRGGRCAEPTYYLVQWFEATRATHTRAHIILPSACYCVCVCVKRRVVSSGSSRALAIVRVTTKRTKRRIIPWTTLK